MDKQTFAKWEKSLAKLTRTNLRHYQVEGIYNVYKGLKTNRCFYLADDTGLGKTVQSLLAVHMLVPTNGVVMIVCPPMLKPKWEDEIRKHLPRNRDYTIIVTTYNRLTDPETLAYYTRYTIDYAVFDEAHYLKSFDSIRTQAVLGAPGQKHKTVSRKAKKELWLSATPMPNRVGELYPFLRSAKHPLLKGQTHEEFVVRWAREYRFTKFGLTHKGVINEDKLQKALTSVMFRRLKDDVLDELPPFNRDIIPVSLPKKFQKLDAKYEEIFRRKIPVIPGDELEYHVVSTIPSFTEYSEFRRKQALYKVKHVLDYLAEFDSKKYIVFTYHIDVAKEYFKKLKVKHKILVSGEDNNEKRFEILKQADKMDECVLVATMNSIKEGFDLTGFTTAFYTEIDWSFSLIEQTEGRLRRIGQKNFVNYYYLLFDRGIENYIYQVFCDKRETVAKVLPVNKTRRKK